MWSSGLDNHNNINSSSSNSGHGGGSRIVSSSSSSRSSPSSNSSILRQNPKTRTMEEVWKDISLTTLHQERPLAPLPESQSHPHHHHPHPHHLHPAHPTASPSFRTMTLQDFLSGPCSTVSPAAAAVEGIPLPPLRPPLPATALSLNSGFEIQYQGGGGGGGRGGGGSGGGGGGGSGSALMNGHSRSSSNSNGFRVNGQANNSSNNYGHIRSFMPPSFSDVVIRPPSPAGLFSSCSKKRMIPEDPGIGGDRRHKRMIKNRESAARSRARKQAHLLPSLLLFSLSLSLSLLSFICRGLIREDDV